MGTMEQIVEEESCAGAIESCTDATDSVTLSAITKRSSAVTKKSLSVSIPRTMGLTDEEKHLGIYEDTADCGELSDSENEHDYHDDSDDGGDPGDLMNVDTSPRYIDANGNHDKHKLNYADFERAMPNVVTHDGLCQNEKEQLNDSTVDVSNLPGLRAKANTPASFYSDISEPRGLESGKNSRLGMATRDAVYKKAMNLMSERCTSVQGQTDGRDVQTPLVCVKNPPYGMAIPRYFYVQQSKPVPMPPLKAWRGYNGNVYFEPIQVNQAKCTPHERQTPEVEKCSDKLKKIIEPRASSQLTTASRNVESQQSMRSTRSDNSVVDKKAVLDRLNQKLREDLSWTEEKESIGGLKMELSPDMRKHKFKPDTSSKSLYKKEKICKGSVAHKIASQKKSKPLLSVSGGKFVPPTAMSPLLRTQTQYSESNQRIPVNSPDLYNSGMYDKLPPLEQLRASLRHIDNSTKKSLVVVPPAQNSQKEKPAYVKYSHETIRQTNASRS